MTSFTEKVHLVVKAIPTGSVLSYGEVAKRAGHPGAARAVASLMAKNYDPAIPCHRVVRGDGTPGEDNRGGVEAKRAILQKEGYTFRT